jgi:hypothetical protein
MNRSGQFLLLNAKNNESLINLNLVTSVVKNKESITIYFCGGECKSLSIDNNEANWKLILDAITAFCSQDDIGRW